MKTWKQAPLAPDVAQFVDCYWLLETHYGDTEKPAPVLIPNPSSHLIITPANALHRYQYTENGCEQIIEFAGSHLIMPSTKSLTLLDDGHVLRLGIKLHPGAQYGLLRMDGKQTLNQAFSDLSAIHPQLEPEQLETLLSIRTEQEQVAKALDQRFTSMSEQATFDHSYKLVRKALSILDQGIPADIEQNLGCSRRTLERSFVKVTGLTLKQYEMMARIDKLFVYLYRQPTQHINWADIASRFGFSDQPHLIRRLKKTIGTTPGNYLNARNLIIDIYGDFENSV